MVDSTSKFSELAQIDLANSTGDLSDLRLLFGSAGSEQTVLIPELVRWGHPVDAENRSRAVLSDGSILIAADPWTVAEQVRLGDDTLRLVMRQIGAVEIPRELVCGILLHAPGDFHERELLVSTIASRSDSEDAVLLTNGDRLRGTVRSFSGERLLITTAAGDAEFKIPGIAAVLFNASFLRTSFPNGLRALVGLKDGSMLVARRIAPMTANTPDSKIELETVGGMRLQVPSHDGIVYLQTLGGRACYLSDMTPEYYKHIPYLDIPWPYYADRNVLAGRLRVGNLVYSKGIGVHSSARLVYKLQGSPRRFAADVAIDDAAGQRGSAIFRVLLAKDGKWHDVFTSPVIRGGQMPQPVDVEIDNAQGLALVVDYADYGDELDYANWIDARLED
ncbi:MAG: NPCBM/NEW2 domain-containing protein [Pirellulales bacterium]|nr:NPCBM/NEW2 domain-containing protein [Pirellulales bacterium]